MPEWAYLAFVLACPVGMGLMMWLMMRDKQNPPHSARDTARDVELAALRAELDQLRAEQRARLGRTDTPTGASAG